MSGASSVSEIVRELRLLFDLVYDLKRSIDKLERRISRLEDIIGTLSRNVSESVEKICKTSAEASRFIGEFRNMTDTFKEELAKRIVSDVQALLAEYRADSKSALAVQKNLRDEIRGLEIEVRDRTSVLFNHYEELRRELDVIRKELEDNKRLLTMLELKIKDDSDILRDKLRRLELLVADFSFQLSRIPSKKEGGED